MSVVKLVSLILLAIYLILIGLVDATGFHLHWIAGALLGLIAAVSGILMLLSIYEYYRCDHCEHE